MNNIRTFNVTKLGESHKAIQKVCQDFSGSFEDAEEDLYVCVVSDGHGGDRYFRSDVGSKLATKIAIEAIRHLVKDKDKKIFMGPNVAIPALTTEIKNKIIRKETEQDESFRQLFSYIISQWNDAIESDWQDNPPTEEEMSHLADSSRAKFQHKDATHEKAYGCTLMAFAFTSDYWFAFQLGDGKCIAFYEDGHWDEPILWDEQCFLNQTTSMCDKVALDNFRYSYGSEKFPVALFMGSDGMDDSFGTTENLAYFYSTMLKMFIKEGYEISVEEIESYLPLLSAKGSRDDMSVAGILDYSRMSALFPFLLAKEIEKAQNEIENAEGKITESEKLLELKLQELKLAQEKEDILSNKKLSQSDKIKIAKDEEANIQLEVNDFKALLEKAKNALNAIMTTIQNATEAMQTTHANIEENTLHIKKIEAEVKYATADVERALQVKKNAEETLAKLERESKNDSHSVENLNLMEENEVG